MRFSAMIIGSLHFFLELLTSNIFEIRCNSSKNLGDFLLHSNSVNTSQSEPSNKVYLFAKL